MKLLAIVELIVGDWQQKEQHRETKRAVKVRGEQPASAQLNLEQREGKAQLNSDLSRTNSTIQ
jgi:hypothetical protein